jgi:hypothetical protein
MESRREFLASSAHIAQLSDGDCLRAALSVAGRTETPDLNRSSSDGLCVCHMSLQGGVPVDKWVSTYLHVLPPSYYFLRNIYTHTRSTYSYEHTHTHTTPMSWLDLEI